MSIAKKSTEHLIKKYPNRRLYDTQTSTYITLSDVKQLVMDNDVFQVVDAKSNEDLTRSILLQIILEHLTLIPGIAHTETFQISLDEIFRRLL